MRLYNSVGQSPCVRSGLLPRKQNGGPVCDENAAKGAAEGGIRNFGAI